jgi:hypothetical protein
MGTVHEDRDPQLHCVVAVKVPRLHAVGQGDPTSRIGKEDPGACGRAAVTLPVLVWVSVLSGENEEQDPFAPQSSKAAALESAAALPEVMRLAGAPASAGRASCSTPGP